MYLGSTIFIRCSRYTRTILQLTQLMTKAEVSFDQLVQQKSDGQRARIVAITHQISKAQMQQVVIAIQNTEAFQLLNVMKVIGDE